MPPSTKTWLIGVGIGVLIVAVSVIAIVVSSMKKLQSDEVALKYDTIFKYLYEDAYYEGLHTGPPGYQFITFSSVFRTFEFDNLRCLNLDGVKITLDIGYQYRVRPNDLKRIVKQFKDFDGYKKVMYAIGEAALHDACSQFNTSQFQTERGSFMEEVKRRLVHSYDEVACDITDLQVRNIVRPSKYENGIRNKESAREDIEMAKDERPRQITEAGTKLRTTEAQADISIAKARSNARNILTKAQAEGDSIYNDYFVEADTYSKLIGSNGLNLNPESFLAYMGVRTISEAKNPVFVGIDAPAKTSYVTP